MEKVKNIPWRDIDPDQQSAAFGKVRDAHQSEAAEDYVELIAELINSRGEARTVDIALCLGVASATVTKTLNRLQREGLITSVPYRSIFLTDTGEALAAKMRHRHQVVFDFLIKLGVSEKNAALDAEGIEHHVSQETLAQFEAFLAAK